MLDLKSLEQRLDLALSKETEESLNAWLLSLSEREIDSCRFNFPLKSGFIPKSNYISEELECSNSSDFMTSLSGLVKINTQNGMSAISGALLCDPPDIDKKDNNYENIMTPLFMESFFLTNIVYE